MVCRTVTAYFVFAGAAVIEREAAKSNHHALTLKEFIDRDEPVDPGRRASLSHQYLPIPERLVAQRHIPLLAADG